LQRRLKGHVDFVREGHAVLFGRESRKKNLFTRFRPRFVLGDRRANIRRS
jgi:hypothetical protein